MHLLQGLNNTTTGKSGEEGVREASAGLQETWKKAALMTPGANCMSQSG